MASIAMPFFYIKKVVESLKYKALEGFGGVVNAYRGEIIEITDKTIAKDLLKAGYVEKMSEKKDSEAVETT